MIAASKIRARATTHARRCVAALILAAPGALGACEEFLRADNPGAVQAPQLSDSSYISLMVNGVIGEFQPSYAEGSFWHGIFTDELKNHHSFFENPQLDRRDISPDNGTYAVFFYNPLQRSRFMADTVAGLVRGLLGGNAGTDLRLARVLAFGAYNYILLGETQCEVVINGVPLPSPDDAFTIAMRKVDSSIAIATAARALAPAGSAAQRSADSILALARVGGGRAALNLNDKARALTYVTPVITLDTAFKYVAWYSINSARETNRQWNFMTAEVWISLTGTPFLAMAGDPRVPRPDTIQGTVDGTRHFVPNSPLALSTYNGTRQGGEFDRAGWMRVASQLEARYIWAEATGPTAETIAFVESRRLISPGTTAVTDATNFMDNLRDQRSRDLYLDTHRLGDLRRYKRYYQLDLYQRGPYPGSTTGEQYGTQECMPLTRAELNGLGRTS